MKNVTLLNVKFRDLLACPSCGNPNPKRAGKCCSNKGRCRVALHRWRKSQAHAAQDERRPENRIGNRSLKALRSDTHRGKLRTSAVMNVSENTPDNVRGPAWSGHRAKHKS